MTPPDKDALPSSKQLLKATGLAVIVALTLLVAIVMPAEFGRDPTGLGAKLGLLTLGGKAEAAPRPEIKEQAQPAVDPELAAIEAKAAAVFGKQPGQSFDLHAVSRAAAAERSDTLSVTIAPGKGAEIKAMLEAGQGFVFHWRASADVAVDMHGEKPDAKDEYTSFWIEAAQREASGSFKAPFTGQHGWFWRNTGKEPVTVQVWVTGFQTRLFQPGH